MLLPSFLIFSVGVLSVSSQFVVNAMVLKSVGITRRHISYKPTLLSTFSTQDDFVELPSDYSGEGDDGVQEEMGNVQIPSKGVSVFDQMEEEQKDRFSTEVVPISELEGVAQIVTTASTGSFEPVRYIVSVSPTSKTFCLVDLPPFSFRLAANIRSFIGPDSTLGAILVTNRDSIHYDEAAGVYTMRRAELARWKEAFPGVEIVSYRLDTPRDCRDSITQCLDGYGPFAAATEACTFEETGRPLTYEEWDFDVAQNIMTKGMTPPDEEVESTSIDDEKYTPEAIREREADKLILAVFTPGHTFGSLSYVFPQTKVCCSGFTIPVEDNREEENSGRGGAGPSFDCRGYISTSAAGLPRQMESAREFISGYSDRFDTVLPARGDPLFLDGTEKERKAILLDIIDQYERIGKVYSQLGIIPPQEEQLAP